ncbi:helix-turn-helix transcriptional regulator [Alicyclobacillus herbarius]|uniref:helix-turn-helix transcriptional regulator n=1 Tax=Alicyclobacillus herbarius TaxID=122960 RepID=UPI00138B1A01|nr:AraC family transcriptional regulator [Alicyclobacillus herbarius]
MNDSAQTVPFVSRKDVLFSDALQIDVGAVTEALGKVNPLSDVAVLVVHSQRPFPIYPFLSALQTARTEVLHVLWQGSRSFVLTLAAASVEPLRQVVEKRLRECCDGNVLAGLCGPLPVVRLEEWFGALEQAIWYCNQNVLDRQGVSVAEPRVFRGEGNFVGAVDRLLQVLSEGAVAAVLAVLEETFAVMRQERWTLREVAVYCAQVVVLAEAQARWPRGGVSRVWRRPEAWQEVIAQECCKLEAIKGRLKEIVSGLLETPRDAAAVGRSLQVLRVMEWIEKEYASELELEDLASRVYLSAGHLSKRFKQETGMTVHEYIIRTRLAKAKKILVEDLSLKIYEVGARVGYPDATYFNKLFKRHVGITPREYRERGGV